jgi:hypothetical protein
MPRKDFKFFQILKELFVFVIDSLVYSPPRNKDSWVSSSPRSRDSRWWRIFHYVGQNWFTKNPLMQNTPESQNSPVINTVGSLYSLVYLSPAVFFFKLVLMLFQIHEEVDSPMYSSQGSQDSLGYSLLGSQDFLVYSLQGSQYSPVYSSPESHLGQRGSFYLF